MGPHGLFWWVGAGVLIVAELMTGTFYLLMIALGFLAGVLALALGAPLDVQLGIAALVALVAVTLLRRFRPNRRRADAAHNRDVNLDIGESLTVPNWHDRHARAMYRGAEWDIELAPGEAEDANVYQITALRGSCLIVAAKKRAA